MLKIVDALPEQLSELEQQREELQESILADQNALEQAKAHQKLKGEYMDAGEFAQLRTNIRENTAKLHDVNRQVKDINRQMSRANPKASFFQQAAKKVLPPEKYDEINSLANKWMKK